MRYYPGTGSLMVRGTFRACSTGPTGGIRNVTSLLFHQVLPLDLPGNEQNIWNAAYRNGLLPSQTFGLLLPGQSVTYSVFRFDEVTIFIGAGYNPEASGVDELTTGKTGWVPGFISIICTIDSKLTDQELLTALVAITEARMSVPGENGFCSPLESGVIIGAENTDRKRENSHRDWNRKIREAIRYGISRLQDNTSPREIPQTPREPSFYIHSTIGGDRWVEWQKGICPYYPCHYKGQRCDFCYCPLYPCEDETLGEWTDGSHGRVWSCAPCTLNHQPAVVRHLRRNPEASHIELKSLLAHNS
ncbi:MAG: adenosylcobinamide amidohydrolase [Methanospirillum sp.]|uniref:cysteine-rich small domain-containing protein n=1 Tax=Methanospirillum sp. TaxID=45200 RepID=UPI00237457E6|nr:cysteine-rich small domain-containing protein [Methanospirillum sp.]MDD1729859.1 adenosylcobinamide amidohydrolase [Methanospirillum sp.]